VAGCVYQSAASLETPASFVAADVSVPRTYVACEIDHAMPIDAQLSMAKALGDNVTVFKVQSGHSVYMNEAALPKVIEAIEKAASS
jgi:poly(3-hydroxyalkanoate) synthetase